MREGIRSIELDHPCYAGLTAGVPCLLDVFEHNGTSTEPATTTGMSLNLQHAAMATTSGVGSPANAHRDRAPENAKVFTWGSPQEAFIA